MRRHLDDHGSIVAEQLMTMVLVVFVALGVMQVALAVHVRNTLIEAAAEGARLSARADRTLDDGASRALSLAQDSLGGLAVEASASGSTVDGAQVVVVTLTSPIPVLGLWGPVETTVQGSALREPAGA